MRSIRRALFTLALLALIGISSAGCSGAPTSSGDSGGSSGNTANAVNEQGLKLAQCMRDNGIAAFPDPDASGALTIDGIANGTSLDTESAAFKQALGACRELQPPGFTGRKRTPEQQEAALKFAQCLRDNGVADFPDPSIDGPLVDTNQIPSSSGKGGMSALNAAMQKCGELYSGQLGLEGR